MKNTAIWFVSLLASCAPAVAQNIYLEQLKVENRTVEKVGDNVRVRADIRLDGLDLNTQHSLRLVPVLVSPDGTQEQTLRAVVVNGRTRDKVIGRRVALGEMEAQDGETVRRRNGKEQTVRYEAEVPYRPWMLNGRLDMRGYATGCADCSEGDGVLATGGILPYEEPQYLMQPVEQPKDEVVKHRSEVRTARLQYKRDSYVVLPEFRSNRAELDSVQKSLDLVKDNPNLTVTGIYVTGYASPEGTVPYNMKLSQHRAETFTAYVQQQNPELEKSLWHVDWKGEDWAGLRAEVKKAVWLPEQEKILAIIDGCQGDRDACEARLKALRPAEIYQQLFNEQYPPLRRNEYRIEYNVRHFSVEEAKELLRTRPDLLSAAEIQKVADSYGRNTDAYREVLQVALKTYPDNVTVRNNAALAEIETEHYAEAVALLKDAQEPSLVNLLGVAYYRNGQLKEAGEAFRRAQEAGYAGAADNLKMLQETMDLLGK